MTDSLTPGVWKQYDATEYFKDLNIPDDWDTLEDFVEWYMQSKAPLMIPWDAEIIRSDDAVAICLFRKGQYQVELYLIYPRMYIRKHCHPRMEVITMELGAGGLYPKTPDHSVSRVWGRTSTKLTPGDYHGGDTSAILGNGFCTLAFQKWLNPEEMSSAAAHWKGELQGPWQAKLIKEKNPDPTVQEDYADITRPNS